MALGGIRAEAFGASSARSGSHSGVWLLMLAGPNASEPAFVRGPTMPARAGTAGEIWLTRPPGPQRWKPLRADQPNR
jgi:hypothetical protein